MRSARYPGAMAPRLSSRKYSAVLSVAIWMARTGSSSPLNRLFTMELMWPSSRSSFGWRSSVTKRKRLEFFGVTRGSRSFRFLAVVPSLTMIHIPFFNFSLASLRVVHSWSERIPATEISIKPFSRKQRSMAVDSFSFCRFDLFEDFRVPEDHPRESSSSLPARGPRVP